MHLTTGLTAVGRMVFRSFQWRHGLRRMLSISGRNTAGHTLSCLLGVALVALAGASYAQTDLGGAVRSDVGHRGVAATSSPQKTLANNVSLEGIVSYNVSGGSVRLQAQTVVNRRSGGVSGSLRVELWAFATPYSGGSATGYKIAQTSVLSPLTAGFQYSNIDQTVTQLTTPPNGTWYLYMFVTEFTGSSLNDGFLFVDWIAFSNLWVIGVALPDLVVTNVVIGSHLVTVNQRIASQSTTVRNDGTATAAAGARLKFYWSTNTVISTSDSYSGWYCDLGSLAPGQSTTCTGQVDAPATAGFYYFGAFVNENSAIAESNYANNTGFDPVSVQATSSVTTTVTAIEYYIPSLDYYFLTSRLTDILLLDTLPSFTRTGQSFRAYAQSDPASGRRPITRFYFDQVAVGGSRGSHFYTLVQSELNTLAALNPTNAFLPRLPYNEGIDSYAYPPVVEGIGGFCASGLIPVYRIFRGNVRFPDNPNHRFTTSISIYNTFVALGWDGEGVKMCVPS
jgi:CARDB